MQNTIPAESQHLIDLALSEDLSEHGDLTSQFFIPQEHQSTALIVSREPVILAGSAIAQATFQTVDSNLSIELLQTDGASIAKGDTLMSIHGSTRSILTAERTALNFLQRLCGIATTTHTYVAAVKGSQAQILDTRKTTPAWRQLEKAAVKAGGGTNHRIGLYDAIMVKDNHLVAGHAADDISAAISRARKQFPDITIELEVDTVEQLELYLTIKGIDVILLDNMNPQLLSQAVTMRDQTRPDIKLEASGGITLDTISAIADTGVDFISVGALTHSVRSVDLSLELQPEA
ncbi:MAG: carboxylating nicotinate-nucleotide diphosphorylase [Verrucomicrobiales bacterium]|nr:carboxylating nicotinate-nucleotide diphosphorylase [Verrucomicrobiales bacterium]